MSENQKSERSTRGHLTSYQVLLELAQGLYANQIAKKYGVSKQAVSYHVGELKKYGYAEDRARDAYKLIHITKKGEEKLKSKISSLPTTKEPIRLHAMQVSMDILSESGTPEGFWDKVNDKMKHWQPSYKYLPSGIGMTLEKTTGKIIIHLHKRGVNGFEDTYNLMHRASHLTALFLHNNGIECDIWSATRRYAEFAVDDEAAGEMVKKGLSVKVGLGRDTTPILPMDKPRPAKAWVDASEGRPEIESNDLTYAVRYIKMPEVVAQTAENLNTLSDRMSAYGEHLNVHLPALTGITQVSNELKLAIPEMRAAVAALKDMAEAIKNQVGRLPSAVIEGSKTGIVDKEDGNTTSSGDSK